MSAADLAQTHALCFETPRPWSEAEFTELLASPHVTLFGDARAFLLSRRILDETEILTLATHPDHRRQGHAHRLLQELHNTSDGRIFLEVARTNHAARALYEQAGYGRDGIRKGYYRTPEGDRVDALIMSTALAK